MRKQITILFLLVVHVSVAQTKIGQWVSDDGAKTRYDVFSDYSLKKATAVTHTDFTRRGNTMRTAYVPEGKQKWNPDQFGLDKYYSPNFGFSMDWNPANQTVAERRKRGINLFNMWAVDEREKPSLPFGQGMAYKTESGLHGELEGWGYYKATLAEYEDYIWNHTIPAGTGNDAGVKWVIFDIEFSIAMSRSSFQDVPQGHWWPTWASVKNHKMMCELDGVTRTMEQIDQQHLWEAETAVRRSNRVKILMKITKAKAKGDVKIAYGPSLYQGGPRIDFSKGSGVFLEGNANINHVMGSNGKYGSNGTIVLNGRAYTGMQGSQWDEEDFMVGYYYVFNPTIRNVKDYRDIWTNKVPGTQTLPYIWSILEPFHVVADEKGYLQLNRRLMRLRQGKTRPILRMTEPVYEGGGPYLPDLNAVPNDSQRLPFAEVQPSVTGEQEPPKLWIEPYINYSRYCVVRFMAGDEPGNGYHMFPIGPDHLTKELTKKYYNLHLHAMDAFYQARNDMQPYERFWPGTTLIEDPEVKVGGEGNWQVYDGTQALNNDGGKIGVQRPAYMIRYKAVPGGWRVVVLGGMVQKPDEEHIDLVRIPGGAVNGNVFRIKLRGPAAHVYDFFVRSSDANQIYFATPEANTSWEKKGYAGRTLATQALN